MFEQVFYGFMKRAQEHNVPEGEARSLFDKIAGAREFIVSLLDRINRPGPGNVIRPRFKPSENFHPPTSNRNIGLGAGAIGTAAGLGIGLNVGQRNGLATGYELGLPEGVSQGIDSTMPAVNHLLEAGKAQKVEDADKALKYLLGGTAAGLGIGALAGSASNKKEKENKIAHSKSEFYIDGFLKAAKDSGMTEGQAVDAYTALVVNANNESVKEADDNALMQLISQNPQLAGMLQGQQPASQQGAGPDISSLIQQLLGRAGGQGGQPGTGAEMFKGSVMPQQAMG